MRASSSIVEFYTDDSCVARGEMNAVFYLPDLDDDDANPDDVDTYNACNDKSLIGNIDAGRNMPISKQLCLGCKRLTFGLMPPPGG